MNGFRLVEGFDDELFESRTGLKRRCARVSLTDRGGSRAGRERQANDGERRPKGFRFLNDILVELLPDGESRRRPLTCSPCFGAFLCTDAHQGHVKQWDYGTFQFCCRIKQSISFDL